MHGGDWNDEKNRKAHSAIDVDGCVDPFAAVVESLATGSLRLCCNTLFADGTEMVAWQRALVRLRAESRPQRGCRPLVSACGQITRAREVGGSGLV